MTVDLAEVFFLAVGENGFAAAGGESEEESEVDHHQSSDGDGGDAGEFRFAREPEDPDRRDRAKEAADGGEESGMASGAGKFMFVAMWAADIESFLQGNRPGDGQRRDRFRRRSSSFRAQGRRACPGQKVFGE